MHYFAHNYAHGWWPPCLALASARVSNSSCIQIQTQTTFCLFANQQLHWGSILFDKNGQGPSGGKAFLKSRFQFCLCIQLTVSLGANLISYLRCLAECQIYSWVAFQICCMHALQYALDTLQNWTLQLWFMLWIMQDSTMCAIKNAFQLFQASNSNPENIDTYQVSMAVLFKYNIWDTIFGRACFMNWQVLSINCNNNLNI